MICRMSRIGKEMEELKTKLNSALNENEYVHAYNRELHGTNAR